MSQFSEQIIDLSNDGDHEDNVDSVPEETRSIISQSNELISEDVNSVNSINFEMEMSVNMSIRTDSDVEEVLSQSLSQEILSIHDIEEEHEDMYDVDEHTHNEEEVSLESQELISNSNYYENSMDQELTQSRSSLISQSMSDHLQEEEEQFEQEDHEPEDDLQSIDHEDYHDSLSQATNITETRYQNQENMQNLENLSLASVESTSFSQRISIRTTSDEEEIRFTNGLNGSNSNEENDENDENSSSIEARAWVERCRDRQTQNTPRPLQLGLSDSQTSISCSKTYHIASTNASSSRRRRWSRSRPLASPIRLGQGSSRRGEVIDISSDDD